MNNKWILYIGGFDLPDRNAAAQRVIANAKAFKELGYNTFFVGLSKDPANVDNIDEFSGFKYINIEYPNTIAQWLNYLASIQQYNSYLNRSPDLIIAYNFPAIALNKLRILSNKKNIPIFADCTEWYEAQGNFIFRLIKGADTKLRMKLIHPKLNGMIAISEYLYQYYKKRMNKVVMVPPLVDLTMCKWNDKKEIRLFTNDDVFQLVYAGSPGSGNKDRIDLILRILSGIKNKGIADFHFTIIGVTEKQFSFFFKRPVPSNLMDNLTFKGRLSHIETLNEIKKAHFYLFLRDNNLTNKAGFPTKFVESISCGTPVLTNPTSNIKDFIIEGKNGFIMDVSSEASLEKSLLRVMNLPYKEINEMKNYCFSSQQFHYSNFISNFQSLLKSNF